MRVEARGRWALSGARLELFQPKGPKLVYAVRLQVEGGKEIRVLECKEAFRRMLQTTVQDRDAVERANDEAVGWKSQTSNLKSVHPTEWTGTPRTKSS